jgi:hypothetical protein
MTIAYSDIPAPADLAAAEATLKVNLGPLRHCRAEPTATQIAAVVVVEGIIVTAMKQQAGWARLRVIALRELGKFLLRTPYLKGRPPKVSTADTLPSLETLGIKDRRIAWRAIQVALVEEDLFQRYLTTDEPTEKGLHREVRRVDENYSESVECFASPSNRDSRGHASWFPSAGNKKHLALQATSGSEEWYTPSAVFEALGCRFDLDVASPGADVVPWIPADHHFTAADNGLEREWFGFVWCNGPYGRGTLPQWLRKFREHANGIALVVDRTSTGWWQDLCGHADLILQVNKKIDFLRPIDEPGTNALGSSLVAYGERGVQALMNAAAAGLGTLFKPCQSVGTRGEDVDAYMTAPSIAQHLVATMKSKIAEEEMPADDLWWLECCAGTGNILRQMPPDKRLGIDINPLAPDIVREDFFNYELDPAIPWVVLTNGPFSNDGPMRIFNRAAGQNVRLIGLVLPAHLRSDKAQWVNRLDPFYGCIHDELLPKESFLRNGKPHDVPARFQIWVRRDTRREKLIERKDHPDLIWVPKSRLDEATIWICRRGPDLGEIIEATDIKTPPEGYYGIRCSVAAVVILRSIRWRDALGPLPIGHTPNMSQADIVREYVEAAQNVQPDDANDDDHALALPSNIDAYMTRPDLPDQPTSSPPYGETRQSAYEDVTADQYVSWWTRLEQIKRVLCPDGPLIASTKGTVIDGERVLELMLRMRPAQAVPHNILFILGCCTNKST